MLPQDIKLAVFRELCENKCVYSQHKYDLGCIKDKFHIKLQKDAELKKQRPSRIPINYSAKLKVLLKKLEDAGIIGNVTNNPRSNETGSEFLNPVIIIPKGEVIKLVLDARYLNSVTDTSQYSWPLESLTAILDKLKGKYFTTTDLSCAYHQVPLTPESQALTQFAVDNQQYGFLRGFYGLAALPAFFSMIMAITFKILIDKGKALTYLDDVLLMDDTPEEVLDTLKQFHKIMKEKGLKAAPEKTKIAQKEV